MKYYRIVKYYKYIFIFLICLNVVYGCKKYFSNVSFEEVKEDRLVLIDKIESYMSIDEFKAYLNDRSLKWSEISNTSLSAGDKRPPYNFYKIEVLNYDNLGFEGKLFVVFFNNRLMSVAFYPLDYNEYIKVFSIEKSLNVDESEDDITTNITRIIIDADNNNNRYIFIVDIRLLEEQKLWIKRYS